MKLLSLDLGFFLNGVLHKPNVALDLTEIGGDVNSLRCLTPHLLCCRGFYNRNGGALGNWRFPNESVVPNRNSGYSISRTRGASSVLLHRILEFILVKYQIIVVHRVSWIFICMLEKSHVRNDS